MNKMVAPLVSTGRAERPTPVGRFMWIARYPETTMVAGGLHPVPWREGPGAVGVPRSHGCIRTTTLRAGFSGLGEEIHSGGEACIAQSPLYVMGRVGVSAKHNSASRAFQQGPEPFSLLAGEILHGLLQAAHHRLKGKENGYRGERLKGGTLLHEGGKKGGGGSHEALAVVGNTLWACLACEEGGEPPPGRS